MKLAKSENTSSSADSVKNTITIANNVAFPTLRKGKAFKALLFIATEVQKSLEPGSVHTVPMSLFSELLKFKLSNNDTALLLEDLEKVKLDWSSYNPEWRGFSHVVSSCRYDRKRDVISYSFDPLFISEYLDSKTPFKNIPLSIIMGFRSNYALKIYELAYQYYDPRRKEGRTPNYSYEEFRSLFNLKKDQYKNSGHFFQKVIKNPLKEVSEVSDYNINFHNNGRRGLLKRYWFSIKLSSQAKFDFARLEKQEESGLSREELQKLEELENKKRASVFLEFWEKEIKVLSKRMTEDERKIWIEPMLRDDPSLSLFAETMLLDSYIKPEQDKMNNYRSRFADKNEK